MSEPSREEVRKVLMEASASTHATYVRMVMEAFGEKGYEALIRANKKTGILRGHSLLKKKAIKDKNMKAFVQYLVDMNPYLGFKFSILEQSERKAILRVTYCPWFKTWKSMDMFPEICEIVTKIDEGMAQAVNPKICLKIGTSLMRGDSHCDYIFEEKGD